MAILAFCMLRTLVAAWYVGVDFASDNRLVTRNKTSLIYALPVAYGNRIRRIEGVTGIGYGSWYGGVYKEKKNFFAQYAISGLDYLDLYPEFVVGESERKKFSLERNACIAGQKLADRFGWKIGGIITLQGTIYPGNIELVLRGIYKGVRPNTDETAFFFRWDFLNERLKKSARPNVRTRSVGTSWRSRKETRPPQLAETIDSFFRNSLAETLTETEKSFQLGFVAMTEAIVAAIRIISILVVGIILMVLANTMSMTARERTAEYCASQDAWLRPGRDAVSHRGRVCGDRSGGRRCRSLDQLPSFPDLPQAAGDLPSGLQSGTYDPCLGRRRSHRRWNSRSSSPCLSSHENVNSRGDFDTWAK